MREIKFRVWSKENGFMYEWEDLLGFDGFKEHMEIAETGDQNHSPMMQYTGLKDKNGKEIYEGDVLHVLELTNKELSSYASPVEFIDFGFLVTEPNGTQVPLACFHKSSYPLFEIEIIGNIYEHPSLLKEENE
ncbi:YopX family protein [Paenibacillus sp. TRM 82003]|nr:YopX family protein [Paenibacillus sp. TRM 82003]